MPYKEIEPKVGGGHSFTTLVYPTSKCLKNEGVNWGSVQSSLGHATVSGLTVGSL